MADAGFDLAVIGAGPAGHVAAERAGRLGKRVLVIERSHLGGVCLNQGCIPTKTLLHSAKLFAHAQHGQSFGVTVEGARYDLAKSMAWKTRTVETLRKGIAFQFRKAGVELVQGTARLASPRTIEVNGRTYGAERILLATGSSAAALPVPGADHEHVMGSTEALEITSLPKSIAIVGGGYIGMEFATYFSRLGVKVAVIEMLPEIVPLLDAEIAVLLRRSLPEAEFHLGSRVLSYGADGVRFVRDGKEQVAPAERVLVAVGRRPIVEGLGLEAAGVDFDRKGVKVDDRMRTNVPDIWAAGDITGRSMLAHSASRMGEVAVADMFGASAAGTAAGTAAAGAPGPRMRWHAIPWVVYTDPEVAGVGLSEAQAKEQGRAVKVAKLDLRANGRFIAENDGTRGMCKVVVDAGSDLVLGVQMIGPYASEIVQGAAVMIEAELRARDVREIVFPHPTVSEIVRDALWELA
ncbi:MAG: dihydrolipoyl dehydrogenase [Spirochaetes bacterium]|nr:dihydrolipoyl dehydrogenase [Spirochaetota bacterium]